MISEKRAVGFFEEIGENIFLEMSEWDVWSGQFNKRLRNAIQFGSEKEKESYRGVFSYWQLMNEFKKLNGRDVKRLREIHRDCITIKRSILDGEKDFNQV